MTILGCVVALATLALCVRGLYKQVWDRAFSEGVSATLIAIDAGMLRVRDGEVTVIDMTGNAVDRFCIEDRLGDMG